jgi:nicotinamidase-related amidase
MPPSETPAANTPPLAEEAMELQLALGASTGFQFVPELVDAQIRPKLVATKLTKSVEQATDVQLLLGALVGFQLAPKSVEV